MPAYLNVPSSPSTVFRVYFFKGTSFTNSLYGKVLNYVFYFIRDVIFLLAETGLNVFVAVLLARQIKNKLKLTNRSHANVASLTKAEQKASQMVLIMCTLSTLEHAFFFAMAVYFDFNPGAYLLGVTANMCITLKHSSNLLLFYYFNGPFRKAFQLSWTNSISSHHKS